MSIEASNQKVQDDSVYRTFAYLREIPSADRLQAHIYRGEPSQEAFRSFIVTCLGGKFASRLTGDRSLLFLLGIVAAHTTSTSLPEWIQKGVKPKKSDSNFTIECLHTWDLCSAAESLMVRTVAQDEVLLVNGSLLVKPKGKITPLGNTGRRTALCVQSAVTAGGTFIQGNWYSPMDEVIKSEIDARFASGSSVPMLQGRWALIRAIENSRTADLLVNSLRERKIWATG